MQSVNTKDNNGDTLFTVSAKYPGTYPTPTFANAQQFFELRLSDLLAGECLFMEITPPNVLGLISKIGKWYNYSVQELFFNKDGVLTGFTIKQHIG